LNPSLCCSVVHKPNRLAQQLILPTPDRRILTQRRGQKKA
jgi:hypothetical protein